MSYMQLGERLLHTEEAILAQTNARRDSTGPVDSPKHSLVFIPWPKVFVELISRKDGFIKVVSPRLHFNSTSIRKSVFLRFQGCAMDAIVNLLGHIVSQPENVGSPLNMIHCYLLACLEVLPSGTAHDQPAWKALYRKLTELVKLARIVIIQILPKVHLDDVSQRTVDTIPQFLTDTLKVLHETGHLSGADLYSLALKDVAEYQIDPDTLIVHDSHHTTEHAEDPEIYKSVILDEAFTLCYKVCWLEYFNALIRSSSVELRVRGVEHMGQDALETWANKAKHPSNISRVFRQLIANFLLAKDVPAYLLGSQSHAALIAQTYNVLGFLIITGNLTKTDADMIWSVHNNAQQVDKAQSINLVLLNLIPTMLFDQLLYFCNKYRDMTSPQFTKHAEAVLARLLDRSHSVAPLRSFDMLYTCIRLMDTIAQANIAHEIRDRQLYSLSIIMMRVRCPDDIEQQIRLTELCANAIISTSDSTTGYVLALLSLLRLRNFSVQPERVSSLLTFQQCSEEFFQRAESSRNRSYETQPLACRMDLMMCLWTYCGQAVDIDLEKKVWDYFVGDLSINPPLRACAWEILSRAFQQSPPVLEEFYQRCTSQYLPALSPDLVTTRTDTLFAVESQRQSANGQVLLPLKNDFIRFALLCSSDEVSRHFNVMLITHLFQGKALLHPDLAIREHINLVEACIEQLTVSNISAFRASVLLRLILANSKVFEENTAQTKGSAAQIEIQLAQNPDSIQIPIRAHKGVSQPQSRMVTINKSASCSDLDAAIVSETGFQKYTVIAAGQKIDFAREPTLPIHDLGLQDGKMLIVQKHNTIQSIQEDAKNIQGKFTVEKVLLSHLDALYHILDEQTAKAEVILGILQELRLPGAIRALVTSLETPFDDVFPASKPLKLRASLEVLHLQLKEQIALGVADENFLRRGVHLLIALLHRPGFHASDLDVLRAAEVLFELLRERPVNDNPNEYFESPVTFTKQLFSIIMTLQQELTARESDNHKALAICALYECLIESILISSDMRSAFISAENNVRIHEDLLMSQHANLVDAIPKIILGAVKQNKMPAEIKSFFTSMFIQHLVPAVRDQPMRCRNIYTVAIEVLSSDSDLAANESLLRTLVHHFATSLLDLGHCEVYGSGRVDLRVQGLTSLLLCTIRNIKALNRPLSLGDLASKLFRKLLFQLPRDTSEEKPIVTAQGRKAVYDLLRMMCENERVLIGLNDDCAVALEHATLPEEFYFPGSQNFIRSQGGYAGLENLAQTCYMNSLLQQLFMNVQFRKFILDTPVIEPERQAILKEFKVAFARMQNSHEPAYRPEALVKALDVDVMSQDDAHIFFTTLIGRLEDSMPDDGTKKTLKAFFGGTNKSQTIGSCGHVSESTDEYFNLSLVVKDKATLAESLNEYTEGAALEGGDKFRCTTCGSGAGAYVDAVRRTALDQVPDNLVLGLKRFRYETFDGGAKVNDSFEFPERIDITKYKLNRLAGVQDSHEPDVFQLVGVVVHSGTLQFGHYWSYAAERGSPGKDRLPWLKFEDSTVTHSEIDNVLLETRGGVDTASVLARHDNSPCFRSDNAYILFYQRVTSVDGSAECLLAGEHETPCPIRSKVPIPPDLEEEIMKENEQMVYALNLFSTDHANFVRGLAGRLDELKDQRRLGSSRLEFSILQVLYHYYNQVFTHSFSPESVDYTAQMLQKIACSKTKYACWVLKRLLDPKRWESEDLILHRKHYVRKSSCRLIMACLKYLREHDPVAYGIVAPDEYTEPDGYLIVDPLIANLCSMVGSLATHRAAWPEYFELIGNIAELGIFETHILLKHEMLLTCLELLEIQVRPHLQKKYPNIAWQLARNRRYDFGSVCQCVYSLLHKFVDLSGRTCDEASDLPTGSNLLLLSAEEMELLGFCGSNPHNHFIMELCTEGTIRPKTLHGRDWSVLKLTVLLTDASKVEAKLYDSTTRTLHYFLQHASTEDYTTEAIILCLVSRTMKPETEEVMFGTVKTYSQHHELKNFPDMASAILTIVQRVFEWQTPMILPHLCDIVQGLLESDCTEVERETADWFKDEVLVHPTFQKPFSHVDIKAFRQKLEVIITLFKSLGDILGAAANSNQFSCSSYESAVVVIQETRAYLSNVADTIKIDLDASALSEGLDPNTTDNDIEAATELLIEMAQSIHETLTGSEESLSKIELWLEQESLMYDHGRSLAITDGT